MTSRPPAVAVDPAAPLFYRFRSGAGEHVLVVPYSRVFDIASDDGDFTWLGIEAALLAEPAAGEVPLNAISEPAPQSISLNVSSSCNLTCGYCYAARGNFGGAQPAPMEWAIAQAAIDRLVAEADPGAPITIGFLGGEPFVNRWLIHRAVDYAASQAARHRLNIRFSVTTNGTLLEPADIALLRDHSFAVTVSLDGGADVQDRQRPRHNGGGEAGGRPSIASRRCSPPRGRPRLPPAQRLPAAISTSRQHWRRWPRAAFPRWGSRRCASDPRGLARSATKTGRITSQR